jgi:signal transduction histidine kinase
VVANLVDNAVRHTRTGVRLVDAGPGVRVEVRLPAATPPGPDDLL